jgi:hypothetical protein
VVLVAAIFGGIFVQVNYFAHHEWSKNRELYGRTLFIIESFPMLFILLYRGFQMRALERQTPIAAPVREEGKE